MPHVLTSVRPVLVLSLAALLAGPLSAQDAPARYPETGLAILDCDPPDPAPTDSCLLRLPVGYSYSETDIRALGESEGSFAMARPGSGEFPDDLRLNTTILLVDLSPGPGGGRRATFDLEKDILVDFVTALPRDEQVAVYGFNERLQRLADFTTDRQDIVGTIESLELQGTNTRIATFVSDSIDVLDERGDTLLRNIVLVSDGQEEGNRPLSEVIEQAVGSGVSISAIGAFWRRPGDGLTGTGMDYLRRLTEGTNGGYQQALLQRPDEAREGVARFGAAFATALERSALVLPSGTPQPSEISMQLSVPTLGTSGQTTDRTIRVTFQPDADATPAEPEADAGATLFGLPAAWVYAAAGLVVAGLLVLALLAILRRNRPGDDGLEPLDTPLEESPAEPVPPPKAAPPASAYLVFASDGRRAPISGSHVNIGRSGSNEIVINDESVSRVHAQIHRNRDGGFSVTDMDSLNGTTVEGQAVTGTRHVRLGDTLQFGSVEARMTSA